MKTPSSEQLRVLIAASEAANFTEAAKRLSLSQGSVSIKLRQLQKLMPARIFTVKGRKNVLTRFGRELYALAVDSIGRNEREFDWLSKKYGEAKNIAVTVGCRPELFETLADRFYFGGWVSHTALAGHDATTALLSRKIDIAVSSEKPDSSEVIAKKILVSGSNLVVHKKFCRKFGPNFHLNVNFLKSTPCLFYGNDGHILADWVKSLGVKIEELKPRVTSSDWRTLRRLVEDQQGYAVLPDYVAPLSNGIEVRSLPDHVVKKAVFYLLYHRDLLEIDAIRQMKAFQVK